MEGDLLEVTMDEVQQLWQLLQLDTEYLSVFETSPAKIGRTAPQKEEVRRTTLSCAYSVHVNIAHVHGLHVITWIQ